MLRSTNRCYNSPRNNSNNKDHHIPEFYMMPTYKHPIDIWWNNGYRALQFIDSRKKSVQLFDLHAFAYCLLLVFPYRNHFTSSKSTSVTSSPEDFDELSSAEDCCPAFALD